MKFPKEKFPIRQAARVRHLTARGLWRPLVSRAFRAARPELFLISLRVQPPILTSLSRGPAETFWKASPTAVTKLSLPFPVPVQPRPPPPNRPAPGEAQHHHLPPPLLPNQRPSKPKPRSK